MRGIFAAPIWTKGPCKTCHRKRELHRGRCYPCRKPADRRQLVEAGVPGLTADGLANIVRKCRGQGKKSSEIMELLTVVHPVLMENIDVDRNGFLKPKSRKYVWIRRNGWRERSER